MAIRNKRPMTNIWTVAALISSSWNLPNDELTLMNRLNSLDISWASLDRWLKVWILLVVVGVSVELIVVSVEYLHELHDFRRGIIHAPEAPSGWLFFFAFLGAGLVAIGVGGEFAIHIKAGRVETEMRDVTARLVALVNEKANGALLEQERLKSENLKLEAIIQPRSLTLEQQESIGRNLRRFAGRKVRVGSSSSDREAYVLSTQIAAALHCAQLDITDMNGLFNGGLAKETGVAIFSSIANKPFAEAIRAALSSIGKLKSVKATAVDGTVNGKPVSDPTVVITVFTKPLEMLGKTADHALKCNPNK
jgi:hypothetical protein